MDDIQLSMLRLGAQGYSCAQIMVSLALEARGEENPGLVRAMAGLAYGCGDGRGTCGALTGGCCVLGLYAGKGGDGEQVSERLPAMLQELSDWFGERAGSEHGGTSCDAIVGEAGPEASRHVCGALVAGTYGRVMEILAESGFDQGGSLL